MSALALNQSNLFTRLGASAAGDDATSVTRLTLRALDRLKGQGRAASSLAFNDLTALAEEAGVAARDEAAYVVAQRFLLAIPSNLPPPELSVDSDGEIVFDWRGTRGGMVTATLRADGRLSYSRFISDNDKEHGTKLFVDVVPASVLKAIHEVSRSWQPT